MTFIDIVQDESLKFLTGKELTEQGTSTFSRL